MYEEIQFHSKWMRRDEESREKLESWNTLMKWCIIQKPLLFLCGNRTLYIYIYIYVCVCVFVLPPHTSMRVLLHNGSITVFMLYSQAYYKRQEWGVFADHSFVFLVNPFHLPESLVSWKLFNSDRYIFSKCKGQFAVGLTMCMKLTVLHTFIMGSI